MISLSKWIWNILGTIFVGLGIAGIILPLVPATPFLLLASACYVRGSERLHSWLINHRLFGEFIRNWHEKRGIPVRVKVIAIVMMWASLIYSMHMVGRLDVLILLVITGIGVTVLILRIRTLREPERTLQAVAEHEER